jgi:hypothetical protein
MTIHCSPGEVVDVDGLEEGSSEVFAVDVVKEVVTLAEVVAIEVITEMVVGCIVPYFVVSVVLSCVASVGIIE